MLLDCRIILLGLSAISSVLGGGSQESDHDISIYDPSFTSEHESLGSIDFSSSSGSDATWSDNDEDTDVSINDAQLKDHSPSDDFSDFIEGIDDEMSAAPTMPRFSAAVHGNKSSTASTTSPSSTTLTVGSSTAALNPIKAALDWLTSMPNSTGSDPKSASSTANSSTGSTDPHRIATTSTKTTDPAKVALDWLTSGLDDKSTTPTTTTATTADSKHSSVVSSILSELEATHTSAAAANRLRPGFW